MRSHVLIADSVIVFELCRADIETHCQRVGLMLFAIGEACAPVGEIVEVYLQRASDLLKAIVRDFPTEDPETGEEYQMFVSGNIYNPILKNKDQSRMWENNEAYSEDENENEDEAYSGEDFYDESEKDE